MVGFVMIVVLVSVILLIFLGFTLRQPAEEINSYEVESFLQSTLQYTTSCENNQGPQNIQRLIVECKNGRECLNGERACNVLKETLEGISSESWKIEGGRYSGYSLEVLDRNQTIIKIEEGNKTNNYIGAVQFFSQSGSSIDISFKVYS